MCQGGDIQQWLEPRNISLCLCLDLFSQLSSLLYLALLYIVHIHIHARYYLCAHACVHKRVIEAPQLLLQRNLEQQLQSPSPGTQTHSWLHFVCQQLIFKFHIICYYISTTPIHPPSRCAFKMQIILDYMLFEDVLLFIYDFGIHCFILTLRIFNRLYFMIGSWLTQLQRQRYCVSDLMDISDYIFSEFL